MDFASSQLNLVSPDQSRLQRSVTRHALSDRDVTAATWRLTHKQLGIIYGLVAGLSNKAIADDLHLAEDTVKDHLKKMLRIFAVNNRTHLAVTALRLGIVPLFDPATRQSRQRAMSAGLT